MRASSRPKKISTSGRATWVESTRSLGSWKLPTLSDCEWRSAVEATLGANGSCTWTMSNVDAAEQALEGAPDVERHRRAARPRAGRQRQPGADREHRRPAVAGALAAPAALEQGAGPLERAVDQPPRLADGAARLRRRRDDDAVAALGEHRRQRRR